MLPNQMHEFASAKKYYCLTIYMKLPSPKKTNMKMHEHIGDDRGNIFGFQDILHWMMLAEPAVLAGSQPDGSPTPHPPGRRYHKKITKCSLFTATMTNQKQIATSTTMLPRSSRHRLNLPNKVAHH